MIEQAISILDELDVRPRDRDDVCQSLELAALLGPTIELDEWRYACELRQLSSHDDIVEQCLVRGEDGAWVFEDPRVRQQLLDQAEHEGRARRHHATCARTLFVLHPKDDGAVAARRVTHLCEAGLFEQALGPILPAAKVEFDRGHFDEANALLDLRESILDKLGVGKMEPSRAQNQWRRAKVYYELGDYEAAMELAEASREVLAKTDWVDECGHVAQIYGRILRDQGQLDDARRSFEEAASFFATAGDDHGLATSRASRGYLELQTGNQREARRSFRDALASFEALDDRWMVSSLLLMIGQTWLAEDVSDEVMTCVQRARRIAKEAGHRPNEAMASMVLGELARDEGDWEEARRCYTAAARLYGEDDNRNIHVARFNLALVEIGAERFDAAVSLLESLEQRYPEVGFQSKLVLVYVGLMTCAAGVADWQDFSWHHARTVEAIEAYSSGHCDIASLAKTAMRLAKRHGNCRALKQAADLACSQLEGLGQQAEADEVRASMRQLMDS